MLPRGLSADGRRLFATRAVRTFAYGIVAVTLGTYLPTVGFSPAEVGVVFTAALAGGALMTLLLTGVADRLGRRRMLVVGAVLMAGAGAAFASTTQLPLLVAAALVGTISPSAGEVGPFQSIEQAMLPETAPPERRTHTFAWYNLVGSLAAAFGALAAGLPQFLQSALGLPQPEAAQSVLWLYAGLALAMIPLFLGLSARVEAPPLADGQTRPRLGVHRSRGIVARLAALFAVDSFAGGLAVQGLIAYWFHQRFGADVATIGAILFGANLFSALSFLAAAPLAHRFGLVNTMVFTHLPSNVLMAAVPLMPSLPLAVLCLLARQTLSQMDVPTRQSYIVAVVDPDERSAAAGLTSVARNVASAGAPALAGQLMASAWPGLPFVICGALKVAYDLALWVSFRDRLTPDEIERGVRTRRTPLAR